MHSLELTALITAAANSLALKMSDAELALLAGIFVQLGDTLATITAERALAEARKAHGE